MLLPRLAPAHVHEAHLLAVKRDVPGLSEGQPFWADEFEPCANVLTLEEAGMGSFVSQAASAPGARVSDPYPGG